MRNIFIGFILVLVDITIHIQGAPLEILPDFLGYIFIVRGLREMPEQNEWLKKARLVANIMKYMAVLLYSAEVLRIFAGRPVMIFGCGLVAVLASLYTAFYIVRGVIEIELADNIEMKCEGLLLSWKIMAVVHLISVVGLIIPALSFLQIFALIVSILFLMSVNDAQMAYVRYHREKEKTDQSKRINKFSSKASAKKEN